MLQQSLKMPLKSLNKDITIVLTPVAIDMPHLSLCTVLSVLSTLCEVYSRILLSLC